MDHSLQTYLKKLTDIQLESLLAEYSTGKTDYSLYVSALIQSILEERRSFES